MAVYNQKQCDTNYVWNGSACVACLNGGTAQSAAASGVARSCTCPVNVNSLPIYIGARCESCSANYTWNGSACVACLNGSTAQSAAASGVARSCRCATTGYTGETCGWCATNYVWDGGKCVACLNGFTSGSAETGITRTCTCTGATCPIGRFTKEWGVRQISNQSVQVGVPQFGSASDCAQVCLNTSGCKAFQMDWRNSNASGDDVVGYCFFFSSLTTQIATGAMAVYNQKPCPTGYTGSSCESCAANYRWNGSACVLNISTPQCTIM